MSEGHENNPESFPSLHQKAIELVRAEYEAAADMRHVRVDSLNRRRPPSMQYRTIDDAVNEFLSRAGAVCTFAVSVGLITADDARDIIVDFFAAHPDLRGDDEPADAP